VLLTLLCWSSAALVLFVFVTTNIERLSYGWLMIRAWWRRRMMVTTDPEWPHLPPPKCGKCGYDLRASPNRCPECGTRVDAVDGTIVRYLMSLRGRQKD
jgi:hypothetical protein